jgi:hypothetical protein
MLEGTSKIPEMLANVVTLKDEIFEPRFTRRLASRNVNLHTPH